MKETDSTVAFKFSACGKKEASLEREKKKKKKKKHCFTLEVANRDAP